MHTSLQESKDEECICLRTRVQTHHQQRHLLFVSMASKSITGRPHLWNIFWMTASFIYHLWLQENCLLRWSAKVFVVWAEAELLGNFVIDASIPQVDRLLAWRGGPGYTLSVHMKHCHGVVHHYLNCFALNQRKHVTQAKLITLSCRTLMWRLVSLHNCNPWVWWWSHGSICYYVFVDRDRENGIPLQT